MRWTGCVAVLVLASLAAHADAPAARVELLRTPDEGIQPQAAVDRNGVVHVVYYKGDPKAGDIFYTRWSPATRRFLPALQVNHKPGTALAIGTIRGAQLAVGKGDRVHVVWNGSDAAGPAQHVGAPLLYTRLNDAATEFEAERDLITYAAGLDGGSSVAADQEGNVYVTWHAREPNADEDGEAGRAVFVARSRDEGKSFEREHAALSPSPGVCACCGMRAFVDGTGVLYTLFRGASAMTNRDEILLVSRDHGTSFRVANRDRWITATCPMSSAAINSATGGALAAWETAGQVYYSRVEARSAQASPPIRPPGKGDRKHPALAQNAQGEILLVWTEGTGWEKGGSVAWQLFDANGQALSERGRKDGVPVWSLATVFADKAGRFVIVY
jgi:hypothetical protein